MQRSALALLTFALLTGSATTVLAESYDFLGAFCTGMVCDNGMECLTTTGGLCSTEADECTCGGAGGEADPYFSGFTGQQFYFPAEAGNVYNLLSEKDHLVNAAFVATELPEESDLVGLVTGVQNSSFIGAVGLQHKEATVEVVCDRAGTLTISVNGEEINLEAVDNVDYNLAPQLRSIAIFIEKDPLGQHMVAIQTDLVVLSVYVNPVHADNMGNLVRGHLDIQMGLKRTRATAPPAHGILGQTVNPFVTSPVADKFPGAGIASDYIVSALFASDYAYNMFGVAAPSPSPSQDLRPAGVHHIARSAAVATSRRMLDSHSQEDLPLLTASFGRTLPSSTER